MLNKLLKYIKNVVLYNMGISVVLIKPRPSIRYIRDRFNKDLVGAEIGVLFGHHAKNMLETLSLKKLYLIDPYIPYEFDTTKPFKPVWRNHHLLSKAKEIAKQNLVEYKDKINFIYKSSDEAKNVIKEKLDFVYIDGDHEPKPVYNDIYNYYKLVKIGGIIAGHNINSYKEVFDGLAKFCVKYKISPIIMYPDFFIIKDKEIK